MATNATTGAAFVDVHEAAVVSSGSALLTAKVTAMVVLGLVSMLVGLLPIKLAKWLRWATDNEVVKNTEGEEQTAPPSDSATLSLLLCGGGGVLLCTTLVQLLPEVRVQLLQLQRSGALPETRAPAAELLLVVGFLTLYLVEELVHRHMHGRAGHGGDAAAAENGHHSHGGHGHSHVPVVPGGKGQLGTAARGLLVVLGLSVHELLEGLAVGLERAPARVWALFVAVASHKFVISFCVGVQLVGMGSRAGFVCAYVGAFSFMSALGIALGMAATASEGVAAGVTATLMQGLAAGTLLYVVFFEVLEPQRASRHAGLRQLLAVAAGFAAMFAIQLAVEAVSE